MWGVISVGIFDSQKGIINSESQDRFYYLYWQFIGLIAIVAWASVLSFLYFYIVKKLGWLRIDLAVEIIGLDKAYFTGITKRDLKKFKAFYEKDKAKSTLKKRRLSNLNGSQIFENSQSSS